MSHFTLLMELADCSEEVKAACEGSMKVMCDIITTNIVRRLGKAQTRQ